jgi:hypothetical protein
VTQVIVLCPRCRQKGSIAPELLGQGIECDGCNTRFIAKRDFWQTQKFNSPIIRFWWLLPSILLAVFVSTGSLSIWLALAIAGIVLLVLILRQLIIIGKK